MRETKDDLVRYRITKARETIEDACILANADRCRYLRLNYLSYSSNSFFKVGELAKSRQC